MKPPRAAVAIVALLALGALALGVLVAVRQLGRPERELAALERARATAREIAARPLPALEALAARAHEDSFANDALAAPGLVDFGLLSLDPKERPVVWHREGGPSEMLDALARALRGDAEVRGELAALALANPPPSFERSWSRGIEDGRARIALLLGRRRGARVVVALFETSSPID